MSNQPKFNMAALSGGKSFAQIKVPQRPVDAEALFKGSRCSTPGKKQFVKIAFEAVYNKEDFRLKEIFACVKFATGHGIAVEGTLITPEGVIRGPWEGATPPVLSLTDDSDRHASCVSFAYADDSGNLLVTTSKWWKGGEKPKLQHWANRPPMVFQEEEAAQEAATILNFLGISAVLEEELDGFSAPKDPEGVYGVVMDLMKKEREDYLAKRSKS